ncbi:hypothetical protein TNIN_423051 [Trichonephila inaurata madagascariensis]|uniref:Uncharacterized protein n=1 Tax=Trichonephila inaurata madagascariensis TaxID=2747483 RepID=A0A8X6XJW6_9ARAC|nr:hypothetical protein TNIN_423051 [Trichonephila inaurata madagascariensis]
MVWDATVYDAMMLNPLWCLVHVFSDRTTLCSKDIECSCGPISEIQFQELFQKGNVQLCVTAISKACIQHKEFFTVGIHVSSACNIEASENASLNWDDKKLLCCSITTPNFSVYIEVFLLEEQNPLP